MPKQHSGPSFLDLPTEIRVQVYSYLLPIDNGYYYVDDNLEIHKHLRLAHYAHERGLQILSTCCQMMTEAVLVLYEFNHFSFWTAKSFGRLPQKVGNINFRE